MRLHKAVNAFQIVFRRVEGLDDILVRFEPSPSLSGTEREAMRETLARDLNLELRIRVTVETGDPGSLQRLVHAARRMKDEPSAVPF